MCYRNDAGKRKTSRKFNLEEVFQVSRRTAQQYSAQVKGNPVLPLSVDGKLLACVIMVAAKQVEEMKASEGNEQQVLGPPSLEVGRACFVLI